MPAPRMQVADAKQRLDATGLPFVFFVNEATKRGNVLYLRYDGHYGLITPATWHHRPPGRLPRPERTGGRHDMTEHHAQRPGTERPDGSGERDPQSPEARLQSLEDQVASLTAAVRALAKGLEAVPTEDASLADQASHGARLAHEILLSQGM